MDSLAYANDQLELVSKHDWSHHSELMDDVDAELIKLNLAIDTLVLLHGFLSDLDAASIRKINDGKMSIDGEICELFLEVLQKFQAQGKRILLQADEFAKKGFRIPKAIFLRALVADDLEMAAIAREARALRGEGDAPKESAFDGDVLSAMANSNYPHRM